MKVSDDPVFEEVKKTYSVEMVELTIACGMAGEAAEALLKVVEKHQSKGGLKALQILGQSFNGVAVAYREKNGWTEEQLTECDGACKQAFADKVKALKDAEPRIVLLH